MVRLSMFALLAACSSDKGVPFPVGLSPLEDNDAAWPDDGDSALDFVEYSTDEYDVVHARGFIEAPLAAVIDAIRTPDACVDRRKVDSWTVEWDTEPEYDASYLIHNSVDDIVTVEFDVGWRHGVTEGTADAPLQHNSRWQLTEQTSFISLLEGSAVLTDEGDGITGVSLIEHLAAIQSDTGTAHSTLQDLFDSIDALAQGRPLPAYDR